MSKLSDKLEDISRYEAQPMGFRPAGIRPEGQLMLLVAALVQSDAKRAEEAIELGADAILVCTGGQPDTEDEVLREIARVAGEVPWGVSPQAISREGIEHLLEMGCDFLIFEALRAPASLLQQDKLDKVARLRGPLDEGLVETLDQLPVDAILIENDEQDVSPSIRHLMVCQHLVNLVSKPLLSISPAGVTHDDIKAMWEVGVDGVVVEVGKGCSRKQLANLREITREIKVARKRRTKVERALLPRLSPTPTDEEE